MEPLNIQGCTRQPFQSGAVALGECRTISPTTASSGYRAFRIIQTVLPNSYLVSTYTDDSCNSIGADYIYNPSVCLIIDNTVDTAYRLRGQIGDCLTMPPTSTPAPTQSPTPTNSPTFTPTPTSSPSPSPPPPPIFTRTLVYKTDALFPSCPTDVEATQTIFSNVPCYNTSNVNPPLNNALGRQPFVANSFNFFNATALTFYLDANCIQPRVLLPAGGCLLNTSPPNPFYSSLSNEP